MNTGGIKKPCNPRVCKCCAPLGTRYMMSNNSTITPTLRRIDNIPYKGNAVLNAQK